ncbi:MAG: conjugal transfer protein TraG, partial [Sphingobacteriales bacterium]
MNTGEDIQGLRKIIDFTRLISLFILSIHFYLACYIAFKQLGFTSEITDKIVINISKTGLFKSLFLPKVAALLCLCISLVGAKGKKDEKINLKSILAYLSSGLFLYFLSFICLYINSPAIVVGCFYIVTTSIGYILILTGGVLLSRLINVNLNKDIFNDQNETFPQEERLLENEYSINLPAKYRLKDKVRDSWINFINPFRGMLVAGTPGAGKSYFVIRHIIDQHIKKG